MANLVSVVIPSYNSAHLVSAAVQSVLQQTYANVEAIIVDDGSTDDTRQVAERWVAQDQRVVYIHQQNKGLGGARNTGIDHAKGEFIAFLDADDLFYPDKIRLQLELLLSQPELGMVLGGYRFADVKTDEDLAEQRPWQHHPNLNLDTWLMGCPTSPCGVLARTEWVRRVGGFASLRRAEDKDMWLRMAYAGCQMAWTPEVVCAYRIHADQMTHDGRAQKEVTLQVLNRFFAQPGLPEAICAKQNQSIGAATLEGAFREYGSAQLDTAPHTLREAIQLNPALLQASDGADQWPSVLYAMLSWATSPHARGVAAYANRFFDHLPEEASGLSVYRADVLLTGSIWAATDACQVNNLSLAAKHLSEVAIADAALPGRADFVSRRLVDYVKGLPPDMQILCINRFFEALPSSLQVWKKVYAKTMGTLHIALGFHAYHQDNPKQAAQAMLKGIRWSPTWATNRGVISILAKWFK